MERSVDPLIVELRHSVVANSLDISFNVFDSLPAAKASVANIHSATFKNYARDYLHSTHIEHWDSSFEPLTVQSNFQIFSPWSKLVLCGRD